MARFNELIKQREKLAQELEETNRQIAEAREEEIKVLADGYIKKCELVGFSAQEAIDALKPYWPSNGRGRGRGAKKAVATRHDVAAKYRDPANPENTWSGRGRTAKWLADYEAQGRKREEFEVK